MANHQLSEHPLSLKRGRICQPFFIAGDVEDRDRSGSDCALQAVLLLNLPLVCSRLDVLALGAIGLGPFSSARNRSLRPSREPVRRGF